MLDIITELDPHFSWPHSCLASTHAIDLFYEWSESPAESAAQALEAAENGLALGEDEPRAHLAFGHACIVTRQFDRAIAAYQRAVELNPSSAVAYHGLGLGLVVTDRLDEAVGMVEQAMRLSPHDPSMHNFLLSLALAHFAAERYEEAVACVRRSLQLKSDRPGAYRILASSYGHMGRTEEAKIALDAMSRLPHWSEEKLRAFFTSDATVNRIVEGLHKAGWKDDDQG